MTTSSPPAAEGRGHPREEAPQHPATRPHGLTALPGGGEAAGPYPRAERLDAALGDPWPADNPYGFAAGVARDAAEEYPARAEARLREAGLHLGYLPKSLGGTLRSLEETQILVRVAARRDVNVMPATMFSISAVMTVLAAGTPEQHRTVAGWVRAGRTIAFGLSEERSGSDVLANTCRLDEDRRLTGTKWLVGRGSTAEAAVVVARTAERGPAAFTAVLLGPEELAHPGVRRLPPRRTTGMHGIDFADLEFTGVPVPQGAVVGTVGSGLAGAMRAQQVVRLMSTAGCLATADTALRTALRFARIHRTGGVPVADTPYGSRELALAAAELCTADLTALVAARAIQVAPGAFALSSSVVKHVATRLTSASAARSRAVAGARAVLREGPGAVLDKAVRDNAMVEVIDTSLLGNLRAIAMHLPSYAPAYDGGTAQEAGGRESAERRIRLDAVLALGDDSCLPPLDPAALDLGVRARDDILLGFAEYAEEIAADLVRRGDASAAASVTGLRADIAATIGSAAEAQRDRSRSPRTSPDTLDLADRLCLLYAAATAALTWWFHRDRPGLYGDPERGGTGWLNPVLVLARALADGRDPRRAGPDIAPLGRLVTALDDRRRLFTALPVRLCDSPPNGDPCLLEDDRT
ncbi:acyl-CoA dehydrogenase family protein [Streptomyces sp. NPDC058382]|uniref:acyl-CoA dehydrogenase family protein n=1 Tax=unclassified Streptomyces TaxID=2593676 RepID=UPI003640D0A1